MIKWFSENNVLKFDAILFCHFTGTEKRNTVSDGFIPAVQHGRIFTSKLILKIKYKFESNENLTKLRIMGITKAARG